MECEAVSRVFQLQGRVDQFNDGEDMGVNAVRFEAVVVGLSSIASRYFLQVNVGLGDDFVDQV